VQSALTAKYVMEAEKDVVNCEKKVKDLINKKKRESEQITV